MEFLFVSSSGNCILRTPELEFIGRSHGQYAFGILRDENVSLNWIFKYLLQQIILLVTCLLIPLILFPSLSIAGHSL